MKNADEKKCPKQNPGERIRIIRTLFPVIQLLIKDLVSNHSTGARSTGMKEFCATGIV